MDRMRKLMALSGRGLAIVTLAIFVLIPRISWCDTLTFVLADGTWFENGDGAGFEGLEGPARILSLDRFPSSVIRNGWRQKTGISGKVLQLASQPNDLRSVLSPIDQPRLPVGLN